MNKSILIVNIFELLAALVGSFCMAKYRMSQGIRYFVYFLWLTVIVEIVGLLPSLIYHYDSFSFFKGTFVQRNAWLYNTYHVISFLFYLIFFSWQLKNENNKKILKISALIFAITAVLNLVFSDIFFKVPSAYTYIFGAILILLGAMLYFFEILQSDEILTFNTSIVFYISIGTLIFHLTVTPLFIYQNYFDIARSPEFVDIRRIILRVANIFMYTCYTFGFIVCSKKNKSYS